MQFTWNEGKSRRNLAKHKVSFDLARLVFDDPFALSIPDCVVGAQQRWQTLGLVAGTFVLLVAHTVEEQRGEELIRIISARKATAHERQIYETQAQKTS